MTYFGFLARFVGIPILILLILHAVLYWRGRRMPKRLSALPAVPVLLLMCLIALVYTTPWDNYLVATRVWWYDPALVSGIVIGWVPIEEYTFFVLQPIMTGLLLLLLAKLWPLSSGGHVPGYGLRRWSTAVVWIVWMAAVIILIAGWERGTYLALELGWALPPIMLQLAFGADILWRYRGLVFWSLVPATLYLAAADALAITAGTWTIDPAQSTGFLIGGVLPVEELLFFFLTNTLLVFGMTLALAEESRVRMQVEVQPRLARLFGRRATDPLPIEQQSRSKP